MNEHLDSFIEYCDTMMIADESFLSNIKNKLKKAILSLINTIETKMKQKRETKFRAMMISFLDKLRELLGDVDNAQTKTEVENIQEDVDAIKREYEKIDSGSEWNPTKDKQWKNCPDRLRRVILSGDVTEARSYVFDSLQYLLTLNYRSLTIPLVHQIKTDIAYIRYFYKDTLFTSKGKSHPTCGGVKSGFYNLAGLCRLLSEDFSEGTFISIQTQLSTILNSIVSETNNDNRDDDLEDLY